MKSLSLIHAIVLLHEGERLSRKEGGTRFVRNSENLLRAKELACRSLGRNLRDLPSGTRILFLLIEKWRERVCVVRKIERSACCFTIEEIRADTGWSKKRIKAHLNILEETGYVSKSEKKYQILLSSREMNQCEELKS